MSIKTITYASRAGGAKEKQTPETRFVKKYTGLLSRFSSTADLKKKALAASNQCEELINNTKTLAQVRVIDIDNNALPEIEKQLTSHEQIRASQASLKAAIAWWQDDEKLQKEYRDATPDTKEQKLEELNKHREHKYANVPKYRDASKEEKAKMEKELEPKVKAWLHKNTELQKQKSKLVDEKQRLDYLLNDSSTEAYDIKKTKDDLDNLIDSLKSNRTRFEYTTNATMEQIQEAERLLNRVKYFEQSQMAYEEMQQLQQALEVNTEIDTGADSFLLPKLTLSDYPIEDQSDRIDPKKDEHFVATFEKFCKTIEETNALLLKQKKLAKNFTLPELTLQVDSQANAGAITPLTNPLGLRLTFQQDTLQWYVETTDDQGNLTNNGNLTTIAALNGPAQKLTDYKKGLDLLECNAADVNQKITDWKNGNPQKAATASLLIYVADERTWHFYGENPHDPTTPPYDVRLNNLMPSLAPTIAEQELHNLQTFLTNATGTPYNYNDLIADPTLQGNMENQIPNVLVATANTLKENHELLSDLQQDMNTCLGANTMSNPFAYEIYGEEYSKLRDQELVQKVDALRRRLAQLEAYEKEYGKIPEVIRDELKRKLEILEQHLGTCRHIELHAAKGVSEVSNKHVFTASCVIDMNNWDAYQEPNYEVDQLRDDDDQLIELDEEFIEKAVKKFNDKSTKISSPNPMQKSDNRFQVIPTYHKDGSIILDCGNLTNRTAFWNFMKEEYKKQHAEQAELKQGEMSLSASVTAPTA